MMMPHQLKDASAENAMSKLKQRS